MLPTPRVIAIDDEADHLEGLTRGLNQYGAACLPIHFDGDTAGMQPCPHVRVIFADLHLNAGAPGDHARDFSTIGGLIEGTIKPSGPYLIVLWTRYPDQANDLHAFLRERLQNVSKPFTVEPLDKNSHLDPQGRVKNPAKLVEAIGKIVSAQPQIGALLNWEDCALSAAADTVSSIIELAGSAAAGRRLSEEVGRLLAKLAVASVGKDHVEEDRFQAVNEALLPILADRIVCLRPQGGGIRQWQTAFRKSDIRRGLSLDEAARLNSLLHIAPPTDAMSWTERGAVVALPRRASGGNFQRTFGLNQTTAADKSFACKDFDEDDNRFRWALVQSQAACDYAQMRPGPLPFHLGLVLPVSNVRKGSLPAALWTSPCFELGGPTVLHVNAGFQMSLSPNAQRIDKPMFRLREQLLNDLIYQVHGYGARPGIISFRKS